MTSMYDEVLAAEADLAKALQASRGIVNGICCALRSGELKLAQGMADGLLERITNKLDEHGLLLSPRGFGPRVEETDDIEMGGSYEERDIQTSADLVDEYIQGGGRFCKVCGSTKHDECGA